MTIFEVDALVESIVSVCGGSAGSRSKSFSHDSINLSPCESIGSSGLIWLDVDSSITSSGVSSAAKKISSLN